MRTSLEQRICRAVLTGFFCAITMVQAQSAVPDTLSDARPILPMAEPSRYPRRIDGVQRLVALRYPMATDRVDHFQPAVPELVAFLGKMDLANTRFVHEEHSLDSFAFDDPLLLVLTGNRAVLRMSDRQKKLLGRYLKGGGLLFAEDVRDLGLRDAAIDAGRPGTPFDRLLKALMAHPSVLGPGGEAWRPVTRDHDLLHSFFQFPDGPPLSGTAGGRPGEARVTELEMLEYRGRVVVVFSDLNISFAWGVPDAIGRTRALQFGANLVIFALAQYATVGSAH